VVVGAGGSNGSDDGTTVGEGSGEVVRVSGRVVGMEGVAVTVAAAVAVGDGKGEGERVGVGLAGCAGSGSSATRNCLMVFVAVFVAVREAGFDGGFGAVSSTASRPGAGCSGGSVGTIIAETW